VERALVAALQPKVEAGASFSTRPPRAQPAHRGRHELTPDPQVDRRMTREPRTLARREDGVFAPGTTATPWAE